MKDINGNQIQIDFSVIPACPESFRRIPDAAGMTNEEMEILRLIQRGKANAITGKEIERQTGIKYDDVRHVISHLCVRHEIFIASCDEGYFIPQTPEEHIAANKSMRKRGISILVRAAKQERRSLEEVYKQARIEYGG